jgi:hypothetical protein
MHDLSERDKALKELNEKLIMTQKRLEGQEE